jgi:eukaryotic-like serine/threonine-protein kinase
VTLPQETAEHLRRVLREPEPPAERYVLQEPVGQGGMGTVYRAQDRELGRAVALKVLRDDLVGAGAAARLEREARILARLEHPGIVPVHDAGTLSDGRVYYVMKLVRGERLEEFTARAALTEVLRLFLKICETVGFAHARGVVHRDLKPSNIMVGAFGEVLVLDWGIARILGELDLRTERPVSGVHLDNGADTAPGTVLGTPGFMAPEQAQGLIHLVDARTDVFALGAILEALLGRDGRDRAPRPVASIWRKAQSPRPEDRYPSAEALAADITRYLDGEPVLAHRESLGERAGRIFRKYQTAIILVLTYLVIRFLFLAARGL